MKNFIPAICLGAIIVFLSSCKKDLNAGEIKDLKEGKVFSSNSIVGKWELRKVIGGFRGIYPGKDYPQGNGNIRIFSDSMYQIYSNNIPTHSGNYLTGRDFSNATGQITDFLTLSLYGKIYFEIENNILTLYNGELAYDGTIEKYERMAN